MKVNFNRTFKDFKGNDLVINGHPQYMADIIAQCLFNGDGAKPTGDFAKDGNRKMRAYKLCMRIIQTEGDLSIEAEDAVLIKESVVSLTPGCYSQIVELIDG